MIGVWWMPWHRKPMKDVAAAISRVEPQAGLMHGSPNGETQLGSCPVTPSEHIGEEGTGEMTHLSTRRKERKSRFPE